MVMKYNWFFLSCLVAFLGNSDSFAAVAKRQSAIQNGTNVRARVATTGLYSQECYDSYYGCMDQFCISDNSNGGSCLCSDSNEKYEHELDEIEKILKDAKRINTEEVEKIKAGAQADIIFNGSRKYDSKGNVIGLDDTSEKNVGSKRKDLMALFDDNLNSSDDDLFEDSDDISGKKGGALFQSAEQACLEQIPNSCSKDVKFLHQLYQRQIESDCQGFANSIAKQRVSAEETLANANSNVRSALKDSFASANKYDRGTCMVEFKKCMQTSDACGQNWENCVSVVASENMQNNRAKSTANTKVKTVNKFDITVSTLEIMDSKRNICEKVLDQCVKVRDYVWDDFLREAAPTIKLAESKQESKIRQSCLTNISDCIQTACKDDIANRGVATMDACLSRPDMARSFCKVEIDSCERMEPLIWGYVVDKLAAMRVDVCTQEVKDCFTDDTRCGKDFSNCIGMDYNYIHDICPLDKLVVCKKNNPNFSMSDLDSMLMGLYLNIDNSALETCQNLVEEKMIEVCGSTTDCNRFAADDVIGTGSLRSQKDKNIYRITGMISFGSIKMGDAAQSVSDGDSVLKPGQIGVADYISLARSKNSGVENLDAILSSVSEELNNISGTINRTIEMIEQDTKIQYCVTGRNLEQITGKSGDKTVARFPNLLNQVKMQIAVSALRRAQDNYNAKLQSEISKATHDASADIAQYMCQMLPVTGGASSDTMATVDTPLATPYAISYDIGSGLNNSDLVKGGKGNVDFGTSVMDKTAGASKFAEAVNSFTGLGSNKVKISVPGGVRESWATFNRDTRVCHYCTSTITKSCNTISKKGFLGIGAKDEMNCSESEPIEKCEDLQM